MDLPTSEPMRLSFMSCSSRATGWRRFITVSTEGVVAYNQALSRIMPVCSHLVDTLKPGKRFKQNTRQLWMLAQARVISGEDVVVEGCTES
ncbi:MAG: hypothetical protein FRX49_06300 [Trebouxia sp. A1-2]|nr:MAG: hypothetical protein FRX49_06300 [Trebouxia sp. A1-2]